ncbi:MAG TPA: FMN-binding negative transcriptional regulator [Stellaceae bacterium]|jgi:transcriptional regulator|nr:FMN-binding negative transcriptional regulator [Stellaceae bacterium]
MVYLPPHFTETREEALLAHIERYDFALLVTRGGEMIASQLPLLAERRDGTLYLQGHLARPNPQVDDLDAGGEALAIFWGPHAYISPSWYGTGPAVPTWNYASVHAYGTPRTIRDKAWLDAFLRRLSERHEAGEANPWRMDDQPPAFLNGMLGGIVGFEIAVSRLEGKFKLSQNRPAADRPRIVAALDARDDSDSHGVARLMRERE